ncbi:hypothetical protein B0T24DRAFT_597499 [Lasiosphaeria ovina]|uniref:Uncharacterized protein n=1 Tax=Lasiosphaeria ovina TaxID=92902 RepID=A0AAE0JXY6_9PEZI|nr:hypothetical protein B0T24DRAFT_597499 [Lasiosphaeria ovina]
MSAASGPRAALATAQRHAAVLPLPMGKHVAASHGPWGSGGRANGRLEDSIERNATQRNATGQREETAEQESIQATPRPITQPPGYLLCAATNARPSKSNKYAD